MEFQHGLVKVATFFFLLYFRETDIVQFMMCCTKNLILCSEFGSQGLTYATLVSLRVNGFCSSSGPTSHSEYLGLAVYLKV